MCRNFQCCLELSYSSHRFKGGLLELLSYIWGQGEKNFRQNLKWMYFVIEMINIALWVAFISSRGLWAVLSIVLYNSLAHNSLDILVQHLTLYVPKIFYLSRFLKIVFPNIKSLKIDGRQSEYNQRWPTSKSYI